MLQEILIFVGVVYFVGCVIALVVIYLDEKYDGITSGGKSNYTKGDAIKMTLLSWFVVFVFGCCAISHQWSKGCIREYFNKPFINDNEEK